MTVASTATPGVDVNSLLTNALAGGNMGGLFGGTGTDSGSGLIGGLILGSLLHNGNMFGGNGTNGVSNAHIAATPTDVQNTVGFINTIQDINSARRDIFDAKGGLQQAIATASQAEIVLDLQGQVSNLQSMNSGFATVAAGQAVLAGRVSDSTAAIVANQTANYIALNNSLTTQDLAVANGFANTNLAISNTAYQTLLAIGNDGDKTRAAIAALAASIPNSRELDLQRQLGVAQDAARDAVLQGVVKSGNVDVTTIVSQNQSQQQQQQQINTIANGLTYLASEIQKNTQSVVNLGTMTGNSQAATNVKA